MKETKTEAYLCAESNKEIVFQLLKDLRGIRIIEIPEEHDWIFAQSKKIYTYEKSWEEAKNDPWIVFHTSGTTGQWHLGSVERNHVSNACSGLPKPIIYTNLMMTSLDATMIMPEATQELQTHHYIDERWYSPLPSLHVSPSRVRPDRQASPC